MEIPLPQDKLLQHLETAIEQRDLHAIKSLSPRINWMHQYRRDAVATEKDFFTYQRQALLALFIANPDEQVGDKEGWRRGNPSWEDFCREALGAMVSHGYRVLDDTYYIELMTEQVDILPIIAQLCHQYVLRGDCGKNPLHKAPTTIPYLEVIKASWHPPSDINAIDDKGNTVFHYLWQEPGLDGDSQPQEWVKSARWLLDNGADPTRVNIYGKSGLDKMTEFIKKSSKNLAATKQLRALLVQQCAKKQAKQLNEATVGASSNFTRRYSL